VSVVDLPSSLALPKRLGRRGLDHMSGYYSSLSDFRDVIELTNTNLRVHISSVPGEVGTWVSFVRSEYRRHA